MKPHFSIPAIGLAVLLAAPAAWADQVCMSAGEMQASLIDWYGETPVSEPSDSNEQIWASERTGTWTMIKLLADGNACVIAQGEDWMSGAEQPEMLAALRK